MFGRLSLGVAEVQLADRRLDARDGPVQRRTTFRSPHNGTFVMPVTVLRLNMMGRLGVRILPAIERGVSCR